MCRAAIDRDSAGQHVSMTQFFLPIYLRELRDEPLQPLLPALAPIGPVQQG
jgi:hypothetical protein